MYSEIRHLYVALFCYWSISTALSAFIIKSLDMLDGVGMWHLKKILFRYNVNITKRIISALTVILFHESMLLHKYYNVSLSNWCIFFYNEYYIYIYILVIRWYIIACTCSGRFYMAYHTVQKRGILNNCFIHKQDYWNIISMLKKCVILFCYLE